MAMTRIRVLRAPASSSVSRSRAAGFTLVELMVAIVLGLIVIGAVLALVLSMIRSNNQTIQATRLTQELRATATVITSELQRAGSAENPFDLAAANTLGTVNGATAGCFIYNYSDNAGTTVNRAISLSGGAVYLGTTACGASGTKLSTSGVVIEKCDGATPALDFQRVGRNISVRLSGHLPGNLGICRTYTQTVFAPGLGPT